MKHKKAKFRNVHRFVSAVILTMFLFSCVGTEWSQTEGFLCVVENALSFSGEGDVLSIAEPGESLLGDICTISRPSSKTDSVSSAKKLVQRNRFRILGAGDVLCKSFYLSPVRGECVKCLSVRQTYSSRFILSYIQNQDGKKGLFA